MKTNLTVADLFATSRIPQAAQHGRRASPWGSLSPDTQQGETSQVLTQLMEVQKYLDGEIAHSSREVKAMIQALGARTSDLEARVETVVQDHNMVTTHSQAMEKQLGDLEML
ncbi:Hypothetical predicted protein, partial [Pelobates cultripes]